MKNRNRFICFLLVVLATGLMFTSCNLPRELSGTDKVSVPSSYSNIPDTLQRSKELPAWREFFTDPMLVQLIDTAIRNNLDLKIATQRIYQAQAGFNYSKRVFFPSINARGSAGTTKYGDYTVDGVGNFDTNFSPNLSDDQRIPDPVPDFVRVPARRHGPQHRPGDPPQHLALPAPQAPPRSGAAGHLGRAGPDHRRLLRLPDLRPDPAAVVPRNLVLRERRAPSGPDRLDDLYRRRSCPASCGRAAAGGFLVAYRSVEHPVPGR